ncbi:potassium efflux system protein [Bacterioplanes sanyensis]|uniref:cation:proton antiporter n=1 Tax=Bacterioplanes sanyensis TaxID=1249553 RepID=UPI00167BC4FA|nr:cation:proton antiporter [Bacterioplanes sanyensis]GGY32045.1 potassium efflux system protein [Bacterioplanes sanyensis]
MLDWVTYSSFTEIAALMMLAAVVGFIGILLRQPLIVSLIAVGLLAGPSGLDVVHSTEKIELLSHLGIAVLLFLVGIKLDVKLIRSIGGVSVMTGLGQVLFTSCVGYAIGLALGLDHITSVYVAVALTFSSTIIIVKLLSDKGEIDSLHGQVALGFLIVQDLVVVIAMVVLATIGIGGGKGGDSQSLGQVALSATALLAFVVIFVRYLADPLTRMLARAPELLMIYAMAQAAVFAAVGKLVGLGMEVGGLLAGVALASTPYRESIAARLAPLRDFLLLFFFIALGSALDLSALDTHIVSALVFSLFVLIGNPLIVLAIMGALGYRKRTGFLAGLTVAQISEFSLIFIAMGISLGHLTSDILGLVTLVGIITIAASTYMITYSHHLYDFLGRWLGWFEREGAPRESHLEQTEDQGYDIIIIGLGRLGTALASQLTEQGIRVMGVDFNPKAIRQSKKLDIRAEYGDATDAAFLSELPLGKAQWLVATMPQHHLGLTAEDTRKTLLQQARAAGFAGRLAMVSHHSQESAELLNLGVDLVLEPFTDAAQRAAEVLQQQLTAPDTLPPVTPSQPDHSNSATASQGNKPC